MCPMRFLLAAFSVSVALLMAFRMNPRDGSTSAKAAGGKERLCNAVHFLTSCFSGQYLYRVVKQRWSNGVTKAA
ncbi:hypothetical protein DUNSADRAFT_13302 [Dunaliella salina]|uniref:Secreted protein n=1 Tax=Dunaliella salina TaxID=3046 RepID=A0ABQ7G9P8_DUNSA|nr:hypothetical protein DUNSADRAFT_13302 [Dunaliella salina]|eukprot:KAF5831328.1 hypothetical protein DUNSADRAFT_13302 [Dunaliella salina]